jgi:uncharacterized protein YjdB
MRNPFPKLASAALALTFALSFAACSGDDDPVAVTGVTVAPTTLTVTVDKTATLTATVVPANAANKDVTWKSDDEATATVTGAGLSATVKGVEPGETTITATSAGDATKKAICTVTVTPAVTGVTVLPTTLDLVVGGNPGPLTATVLPEGVSAADSGVAWTSDKTDVATVTATGLSVTVNAVAAGTPRRAYCSSGPAWSERYSERRRGRHGHHHRQDRRRRLHRRLHGHGQARTGQCGH